jgi:hypothetical protein
MTISSIMGLAAKDEDGFRPRKNVKARERPVVSAPLPPEQEPAGGRRSIKELPFHGMWAGHIEDGVRYVDNLRDNPKG